MINKKTHIEAIRIFALLCVFYTHTGLKGMHYYQVSSGVEYWISMALTLISQISVCLFFMISGANLLKKEEDLKTIFTKRVLRIVIVLLVMVLFQQWYLSYTTDYVFSIKDYPKMLYTGGSITQQWYLYAYLGFLLMLPFLRQIVNGLSEDMYRYLFVLMIVLGGICPLIERFANYKEFGVAVPLLANMIFYPIIGHYVENVRTSRLSLLEGATAIAAINLLFIANTWLVRRGYVNTGVINSLVYFTPIYTVTAYMIIRMLYQNVKGDTALGRVVCYMGQGVFAAYLFEPQIREATMVIYDKLEPHISHFPALILWLVACIIIGTCVGGFLKKIPGIKSII